MKAAVVIGCLKPTPITKTRVLTGIAQPVIRRRIAAEVENMSRETDNRHTL